MAETSPNVVQWCNGGWEEDVGGQHDMISRKKTKERAWNILVHLNFFEKYMIKNESTEFKCKGLVTFGVGRLQPPALGLEDVR